MEILVFFLMIVIGGVMYFYTYRQVKQLEKALQQREEATDVYLGIKMLFRDVAMSNLLRRIPREEMDGIYAEAVDGLMKAEDAMKKAIAEGSVNPNLEARQEFYLEYHRKLKETKAVWDRLGDNKKDV